MGMKVIGRLGRRRDGLLLALSLLTWISAALSDDAGATPRATQGTPSSPSSSLSPAQHCPTATIMTQAASHHGIRRPAAKCFCPFDQRKPRCWSGGTASPTVPNSRTAGMKAQTCARTGRRGASESPASMAASCGCKPPPPPPPVSPCWPTPAAPSLVPLSQRYDVCAHYTQPVPYCTQTVPYCTQSVLKLCPTVLNLYPTILNLHPTLPNMYPTVLNLHPRVLNMYLLSSTCSLLNLYPTVRVLNLCPTQLPEERTLERALTCHTHHFCCPRRDLSGLELQGTLPEALSAFKHFSSMSQSRINMSRNRFHGTLPASWSSMRVGPPPLLHQWAPC